MAGIGPAARGPRPPGEAAPLPRIEVAAAIIRRGRHVLISRRNPDAHMGGLWEFPGGGREGGETLEQCLEREIREELNLTIRVGRLCCTVEHEYPERHVTLFFFFCVPVAGTPEALGCQEFRWVDLDELDEYDFPPADRSVLQVVKAVPGL